VVSRDVTYEKLSPGVFKIAVNEKRPTQSAVVRTGGYLSWRQNEIHGRYGARRVLEKNTPKDKTKTEMFVAGARASSR